MPEITPVRDPVTGHLLPGARLSGGGNPLAKLQYENRKRFLDGVTPEELDKARAGLVADMFDPSARVRAVARGQYYEWVHGKSTLPVEISKADDARSGSAADDTLARVLAVLEKHPAIKSEVADALLGDMRAIEVDSTVVSTEVVSNGLGD
jgi:hypothetical protein